jgi:hypothetical protein
LKAAQFKQCTPSRDSGDWKRRRLGRGKVLRNLDCSVLRNADILGKDTLSSSRQPLCDGFRSRGTADPILHVARAYAVTNVKLLDTGTNFNDFAGSV